jgi:hypothetical protein
VLTYRLAAVHQMYPPAKAATSTIAAAMVNKGVTADKGIPWFLLPVSRACIGRAFAFSCLGRRTFPLWLARRLQAFAYIGSAPLLHFTHAVLSRLLGEGRHAGKVPRWACGKPLT